MTENQEAKDQLDSDVKDTTYHWSATELEAIKCLLKAIVNTHDATTIMSDYYSSSKDC